MSSTSRMQASPRGAARPLYQSRPPSSHRLPSHTPHPYPDDLVSRLALLLNKIDQALPAAAQTLPFAGIAASEPGPPIPDPGSDRDVLLSPKPAAFHVTNPDNYTTPRPLVISCDGLAHTDKMNPDTTDDQTGGDLEASQSHFSTSPSLNARDDDPFNTIDDLADSRLGATINTQLPQSPGTFFARKSLPLGSLVDGFAPPHLRPTLSPAVNSARHSALQSGTMHPGAHNLHNSRIVAHLLPSPSASADGCQMETGIGTVSEELPPLIALSTHRLNMVMSLEYQATITVTNVCSNHLHHGENTGVWFEVAWPAHRLSVVPSFGFLPPAYSQDIFVTFVPEFFDTLPAFPPQVQEVKGTTLCITVNGTFMYTVDIHMLPLIPSFPNTNQFK